MFTPQEELEFRYSKRHIKSTILDSIDTETGDYLRLMVNIKEYLSKTYSYESKNKRITHIVEQDIDLDVIALEILTAVLPIQSIHPIQGVCTKLSYLFNFEDRLDGVKTAAEILAVTEGVYFELYSHDYWDNSTGTMGIKSNIVLDKDLQNYLDNVQYLPPMLSKPKDWISNTGGGMHTSIDSVILGNTNNHNERQALEVNNILQDVEYSLNQYVLNQEELPSKPLINSEQVKQFNKFVKDSNKLYEMYWNRPFHFIWKNDKRGRLYSQGYHINPQGAAYKKASIDFNHKRKVTGV